MDVCEEARPALPGFKIEAGRHKKELEGKSLDAKSRGLRNQQAMINDAVKTGKVDLVKAKEKAKARGAALNIPPPSFATGILDLTYFLAENKGKDNQESGGGRGVAR